MRSAFLLFITAVLTCGCARAEGAGFRNMMPYAEARETFKRLGYRPFMMPGADFCEADDPRCFPELEYCAKSRSWSCTYTWMRGKAIIEVETRYDHPVVARTECVVNCTKAGERPGSRAGKRPVAAAEIKRPSVD